MATSLRPRLEAVVCACAGALALSIALCALSDPHALYGLTEFDDAIYFAGALHLVGGQLPYHDFVFVQPPGITLILAPIAGWAHVVGTRDAMAVARIFTALIDGANAFLVGWLVRHRGLLAAAISSFALAIFPSAYFADHTTLLEPFVVFFCLLGANLAFRRGAPSSNWRLFFAGAAFGIAISTKLWGVIPAAIALACCLRRPALRVLAGMAAGVVVICFPFFVAAPSAFFHDIVTAQLGRQTATPVGFLMRLWSLVGLRGYSITLTFRDHRRYCEVAAIIIAVLIFLGGVIPLVRKRLDRVEIFSIISVVAIFVMLLIPPEYYTHYAYFFAPFLALALGVTVERIVSTMTALTAAWASKRRTFRLARQVAALGIVVVAIWCLRLTVGNEMRYELSALRHAPQNYPIVAAAIPKGSCVLTDAPSLIIEANRFLNSDPTCPLLIDADGTWLAYDGTEPEGVLSKSDVRLVALWANLFAQAPYVELSSPVTKRIPWTPALRGYFNAHFVRLDVPAAIYRRN